MRARNYDWAELTRRVFEVDVLECEQCGGRMKVIAALTQPRVIARVLGSLGMRAKPPTIAEARGPPDDNAQLEWDWPA